MLVGEGVCVSACLHVCEPVCLLCVFVFMCLKTSHGMFWSERERDRVTYTQREREREREKERIENTIKINLFLS
jgi:hypothetical protein